jgi:uncharacterized membrane protein
MSDAAQETGPVDYVVIEFPGMGMKGEGLSMLIDLTERGLIRILDLLFIAKQPDGTVTTVEVADLDGDGTLDLAVFEGARSGLIGDDDIAEAGTVLEPGSSAGILVYENRWAAPFVSALRRNGARLVASGRIPFDILIDAVETAEARP